MERRNYKIIFYPIVLFAVFFITFLAIESGFGENMNSRIMLGTITIDAGDYDRINTPVRFQCKPSDLFGDPSKFRREGHFFYIGDGSGLAVLRDHKLVLEEIGVAKAKINVQWDGDSDFNWEKVAGKGSLIWILEGKTTKGTKRTFNLVLEKGKKAPCSFSFKEDNKKIIVKQGNKSVFCYNFEKKEGQSSPYARNGYMHPVWTPSGKIITADISKKGDNLGGIFNAWKRLKFSEGEVNFWDLGAESGGMFPDTFGPSVIEGPVFLEIDVFNRGIYKNSTMMREVCDIKAYSIPEDNIWMLDMHFTQVPVNPKRPVRFPTATTTATVIVDGKVKRIQTEKVKGDFTMEILESTEGGLTFRGTDEWLSPEVLTSEGKTRTDGDLTEARWINYSGPIGNEWGGLTIFDHPMNLTYPTPVHINSEIPSFSYAFAKKGPFSVITSNPLELVYRFVVHNGRPNKELNERVSNDFTNPPTIKWEPFIK